jgi:serine/threonine protein kinase
MPQSNQRVGEYILDEPLGQTAYVEEWRAHHHMWSDQLAVVKIPTDPQYANNLRQDGVRVHRLVHPNIICPLGFDPHAQPPYLITELAQGESLRPWINARRLTVGQSVNILKQVLEALQFGHERQVVHGDVRPENILLDGAATASDFSRLGSVKLADFGVGLAAMATATQEANRPQAQGSALAYVAPEQRDGAAPDVKSDIYAVGVVLFEMLTGERPSGAELPSEMNPQVPAWLDDVFRKSYARRERRFESAQRFLEALSPAGLGSPAGIGSAAASGAPAIARAVETAPPPTSRAGENVIRIRGESAPIAPPPARGEPVGTEPAGEAAHSEIRLAADDDYSAPASHLEEGSPEEAIEGEVAVSEDEASAEPVDEEQIEEQQEAGANTATLAPDQTSNEPVLPLIPRVASPADRDAIFDELNKRQVRTPDDLRAALKGYFELRDLDQGESANIRLRLIKWANSLAGGNAEMEDQLKLINAAARPLYIVYLLLRSTRGDEPAKTQLLEHPIGEQAGTALRSNDYRLIAHFSATALNEQLLETIASLPLRTAVINLAKDFRREFFGRIQREDLLIFRANVITAAYRYDQKKYRAFMVGSTLGIVSAGEPFTRIRQEPTKRAATLLNGEQVQQGIKELRRGLEDAQWESKAMTILSAFRGKLAAAYVQVARGKFNEFGWLESLNESAKAGQLVPGHEGALEHAAMVRKRIGQLQLLPGTCIAVILIGLSNLWSLQQVHPLALKPLALQLVQSSLFGAGVAAWIATLWSHGVLRARMARTDLAFYQAAVFPLLIAVVFSFITYTKLPSVAICGGLLVAVIVGDVMIFKKFRRQLIRIRDDSTIAGDGLNILWRIETMLHDDWEALRPHYLELGPLFSFTSVQASQSAAAADLLAEHSPEGGADETMTTVTGEVASEPWEEPSSGNPQVDALVSQMHSRISANLRVLAPAARMLLTIFGEYSKAVANHQLGMQQANAGKLEQKGKELLAKLVDFERLCRSPLTLESGGGSAELRDASRRLAERCEDPDINLLRSLAERAKTFREDQTGAAADIKALQPQVEAVIERLKKG